MYALDHSSAAPRTAADLSEIDKADIRHHVLHGGPDSELLRRREECARQYGVSVRTIMSILAWVKIRNNRESEQTWVATTEIMPTMEALSRKSPAPAPSIPTIRAHIAEKIDQIYALDAHTQKAIIDEMRDILGDPHEVPYVDEHIVAIAWHYKVSAWTIELLSGRNIPNARKIIEGEREKARQALEFETATPSAVAGDTPAGATPALSGLRRLDEASKRAIREYVAATGDAEEKKRRRREMAAKYGLTIHQIAAITAWTTIWWDRAQESGLESLPRATEDDGSTTSEAAINWPESAEAVSPGLPAPTSDAAEVPVSPTASEATSFGSPDGDFLRDLARGLDLSDLDDLELFSLCVRDTYPDTTDEEMATFVREHLRLTDTDPPSDARDFIDPTPSVIGAQDVAPGATDVRGEGLGARIDYDTPIKNAWRAKVREYIESQTDPKKRASMRVLCLPGVECLEIPMYLEMGFLPENIVGVEAGMIGSKVDRSLISRFEENAKRYGIRTHIGRLEQAEFLKSETFDVVSLDFVGPFGFNACDIFSQLHLSQTAVIVTNFQAKREKKGAQSILQQTDMVTRTGKWSIFSGDRLQRESWSLADLREEATISTALMSTLTPVNRRFEAYLSGQKFPDPVSPKDLYSLFYKIFTPERLAHVSENIAKKTWREQMFPGDLGSIFIASINSHISMLLYNLGKKTGASLVPEGAESISRYVQDIIGLAVHDWRFLRKYRQYVYANRRTPMITECFTLGRIMPEKLNPMKHSNRFWLAIIDELLRDFATITATRRAEVSISVARGQKGGLELVLNRGGKRVASLDTFILVRDLLYFETSIMPHLPNLDLLRGDREIITV